jgi:glycosyltransferase involved in cell wall biosynthesis
MLIGIEASRANRLGKTGVEWYAYSLIQKLKELPDTERHSWFLYSNDPLSKGLERGNRNWHERQLRWPPKYLWTQVRLSWEMLRRTPDVLFVPAHVLPRFAPKRSVVTIHDVGYHRFPELYPKKQVAYHEWATKDIVKNAAKIITVSEFSKNEIVEFYGADPAKIHVTYLGVDHERYVPAKERGSSEPPFALFIGRLESKKNIANLVRGFTKWKEAHPDDALELVLGGMPGAGFPEIEEAITQSSARDAIRLLGYVSEAEKIKLMQSAFVYIQPSYYEGFGLPPLEAMACGTPVIASLGNSMLEVLDEENALFFSPEDIDALAEGLSLLQDEAARNDYVERGLAKAKEFTWEKTAEETFDILTAW